MEGVDRVKIHIYVVLRSIDEFMLDDRNRLLWNRNVLVGLPIITEETDERCSCCGSNDQR